YTLPDLSISVTADVSGFVQNILAADLAIGELAARTGTLTTAMTEAGDAVSGHLGAQLDGISGKVSEARTQLADLTDLFSNRGSPGVLGGFSGQARAISEAAEAVHVLSQSTGIASDKLLGLQFAAASSGLSAENLTSVLSGLGRSIHTALLDSMSPAAQT